MVFFNGELEYEGKGDGTYPRRAMLMEVMEGDLEPIWKEFEGISLLAFKVQFVSITVILNQNGVITCDANKTRNILFKTLSAGDLFKGKKMIDFDFWKYVFGEHEFYLPQPKYLIKLGDYDSWVKTEDFESDPIKTLGNHLRHENSTLKELEDIFKKPEDPHAKILKVYDSTKSHKINQLIHLVA